MARKKSFNLTEAELRLMDVVWDKGAVTVGEVAAALTGEPILAYNTILTTLRILEQKGYVRHTKSREGRAVIYRAVVGRKQASRNALCPCSAARIGSAACAELSPRCSAARTHSH